MDAAAVTEAGRSQCPSPCKPSSPGQTSSDFIGFDVLKIN